MQQAVDSTQAQSTQVQSYQNVVATLFNYQLSLQVSG